MGYKTNAVLKGAEVVGAKKGLRDDVQKFMHKDPKGKDVSVISLLVFVNIQTDLLP